MSCGDKVRFWEDVWVGGNKLSSVYPRLFTLGKDQGLTVSEVGVWEDSAWIWKLRWRRVRFE